MTLYEDLMTKYAEPTHLTILKATSPAVPLTKTFTEEGSESYPNAYMFDVKQFHLTSLGDLFDAMTQLQSQKNTCIIRGRLKGGLTELKNTTRLIKDKADRKAAFEDGPSKLLHLDVDGLDSDLPMEQWADHVISLLPQQFQEASYIYQFSSSAGIKPGIRLHLWFYLTFPATSEELKRWWTHLPDDQQVLMDEAVWRPVQVNYFQDPIFEGVTDPVNCDRMGYVEKGNTVPLVIPEEPLKMKQPLNTDIEYVRTHAGDPWNAVEKKLWQVEHSGRLHVPIFSAMSTYKWYSDKVDVPISEETFFERLIEAIGSSNHPDKEGVYITEAYLEAQYNDADIGESQSGFEGVGGYEYE